MTDTIKRAYYIQDCSNEMRITKLNKEAFFESLTYNMKVAFEYGELNSKELIEKIDDERYRANTIFTLDMAYSSARLLMKPEVDWLIEK